MRFAKLLLAVFFSVIVCMISEIILGVKRGHKVADWAVNVLDSLTGASHG
jgi:hypothetical protein